MRLDLSATQAMSEDFPMNEEPPKTSLMCFWTYSAYVEESLVYIKALNWINLAEGWARISAQIQLI